MTVLERIARDGHEGVHLVGDRASGLQAIIAVHSTALGPALGGARFYPYAGFEQALEDVLRLSRAMTYKAAAAGLALGGGKAVIVGDPHTDKSESLLEAYGRGVDALGGAYITAEDVGTTVEDMTVVRRTTGHVTGLPVEMGGSGDPSPATAHGVVAAMRAVVDRVWGTRSLEGRSVAVQGVGKVGAVLVELLAAEGVGLVVADVDRAATEWARSECGAAVVPPDEILFQEVDLLAPCALGGVIDAATVPRLRCRAVVGSANNQLAGDTDARRLADAGVLYAPDFVVNAGGIINISEEMHPAGYAEERALERVARIEDATRTILDTAEERGITTLEAARIVAEQRISSVSGYTPASR